VRTPSDVHDAIDECERGRWFCCCELNLTVLPPSPVPGTVPAMSVGEPVRSLAARHIDRVQTLIEHGARGVDGFGDDIEDAGGINHAQFL